MNIEQAKKASEIIIKAGIVPMLWGPPGIGKTTLVKQLAEKHATLSIKIDSGEVMDFDSFFKCLTTNLLMLDHLTGIPFNNGGSMVFSRPANIPADGKGFLLIDEITDGMLSIQKMLYSLVLERECNGHRIGDGWKVLAAGNRPSDGSGSSMLPSALISRMVHIGVCCEVPDFTRCLPEKADVDVNSWVENFALPARINPFIIAFLKSFLHRIYHFQATPRTFEMLSKILSVYNNPDAVLHEIILGCIGSEVGNEFFGFFKLAQQIPSIDAILKDPANAPVPQDIGIMHALTTALVYRADRSNFPNIIEYSKRLGHREMEIYLITAAIKKDADLASVPAYLQWHNDNGDILN